MSSNDIATSERRGGTVGTARKIDDLRFVPGVGGFDDDCTDREWFDAMGPAPDLDASDDEVGPVCEDCLKYLPDDQIATKHPRILCEDCQDD